MSEKLLTYDEASLLVAQRAGKLVAQKPRTERVPLAAAAGRVLALALVPAPHAMATPAALPRSTHISRCLLPAVFAPVTRCPLRFRLAACGRS
jgi:hypothetical protein